MKPQKKCAISLSKNSMSGKLASSFSKRSFNRICNTDKSLFKPVVIDETGHVSSGILVGPNKGYKANLFHNSSNRLLGISVNFDEVMQLSFDQLISLMRIQDAANMARVVYDPENRLVKLRASSICPELANPSLVMHALLADIRRVLADDRFHAIIDN